MDGWMDGLMDGWMDGWIAEWMDGWMAAEFMDEDGWLEDGEEEFGITDQGTTRAADVEVDLKGA